MIRTRDIESLPRSSRRDLLRFGFLSATALALAELVATIAPFIKVTRVTGLGEQLALPETRAQILERFASTGDEPILFAQHRFFLVHAPGGVIAAFRRCPHLGCAVPFVHDEDRFHCPCHQSTYDKRTALNTGGPAPRGLDLFHIREEAGALVVNTNPLELLVRSDNRWHPEHVEVTDSLG